MLKVNYSLASNVTCIINVKTKPPRFVKVIATEDVVVLFADSGMTSGKAYKIRLIREGKLEIAFLQGLLYMDINSVIVLREILSF